MNQSDIEKRVRSTIVRTFGLPPRAAAGELRMSDPPAWDSLGHMGLVAALEKEFGVRFPGYVLPELIDVQSIIRQLAKQQLR